MTKSITREFRRQVREEMRASGSTIGMPWVVPAFGITDDEGRVHFVVRAD